MYSYPFGISALGTAGGRWCENLFLEHRRVVEAEEIDGWWASFEHTISADVCRRARSAARIHHGSRAAIPQYAPSCRCKGLTHSTCTATYQLIVPSHHSGQERRLAARQKLRPRLRLFQLNERQGMLRSAFETPSSPVCAGDRGFAWHKAFTLSPS